MSTHSDNKDTAVDVDTSVVADTSIVDPDVKKLVVCEIEQLFNEEQARYDRYRTDESNKIPICIQPKLLKTTLYLERRYRLYENETRSTFTWAAVPTTNRQKGSICYVGELRNVVAMRIGTFTFHYEGPSFTTEAIYKRNIQVLVSPYEAQSCINGKCRFHFMGRPYLYKDPFEYIHRVQFDPGTFGNGESDNKIADTPYNRSSDLMGIYQFNEPITVIDDISISLFSNFSPLSLARDLYNITNLFKFSSSGVHVDVDGKINLIPAATIPIVYIEGFTTTDPVADQYLISTMNRAQGWKGQVIGSNRLAIGGFVYEPAVNFDTVFAGVVGTFVYKNATAYLSTFDFYMPIEFTHLA